MERTTVLSIRVPKELVEKLKESGIEPAKAAKEALNEAYEKALLEKLYENAELMKNLTKEELLKAIKEGRA